jgi:hypothetical protein
VAYWGVARETTGRRERRDEAVAARASGLRVLAIDDMLCECVTMTMSEEQVWQSQSLKYYKGSSDKSKTRHENQIAKRTALHWHVTFNRGSSALPIGADLQSGVIVWGLHQCRM